VGTDSRQYKDARNRRKDDSHRTRSSRYRKLDRPSSRARRLELQSKDLNVERTYLEILTRISRASNEIGWLKRGCEGVLLQ